MISCAIKSCKTHSQGMPLLIECVFLCFNGLESFDIFCTCHNNIYENDLLVSHCLVTLCARLFSFGSEEDLRVAEAAQLGCRKRLTR